MKIKKNKLSLLFLAIMLPVIIGLVQNVKADDTTPLTEQAVLTINGVDEGDVLSAYKVLNAYKNDETNEVSYRFTENFQAFLTQSENYSDLTVDEYYKLTSGDITTGSTKTTSTLDALASAYASYVKRNSVVGLDMTTTATSTTLTADVGTYLVLPKTTKRVYAVMVGNLDYKEQDGAWAKQDATITAKVSDASVTKSVGTKGEKNGSFRKNQEFTYYIAGTVPSFPTNATNKAYVIKDTLSTGLTHSGIENVVIEDGETELTTAADGTVTDETGATVATITLADQVMTITFDVTHITSTTINVSYKAKLNDQAILGEAGNTNDVVLTYANDPYADGTYTTTAETAKAYTYGLKVLKYQEGDTAKKGLAGAEFDIYEDNALTTKIATITTDENGYGTYASLGEGTYYLKETKAPAGYTLIKNAVAVEITKENVETTGADEGYQIIEITNKKAGILPFTGGMGTIIYTVAGLMIVGVAATGVVTYRKKVKKIRI